MRKALERYPNDTQKEIAEKLELNQSTISRLLKKI
ncbi:helix-turn-helix domain-containing protein [Bacillus taeanensis]|uniref:HTH iclR-type domain-containing protein n=1 Tax=Bacillus taeanensis TaxID=273032 RepID=A0A366XTZ1_9BACI|nr:hypothetical protein DS031_17790 [Bacillus taeanensis]